MRFLELSIPSTTVARHTADAELAEAVRHQRGVLENFRGSNTKGGVNNLNRYDVGIVKHYDYYLYKTWMALFGQMFGTL